MSVVHFTYNGLEGTVNKEDMITEEQLRRKLYSIFGFNDSTDFTGVKQNETNRLYSLQEIVNRPSLFSNNPGSIIIGPLSPKSHNRSSSVIESIFKYVLGECSNHGQFKYLDYFVLRVLYNRKASYFTYAINLMLDKDYPSLCNHLHTLILQAKDSTAVKIDILRLITLNMQMNKELTYEHVSILLSLIKKEDGLICSAYNKFEENDDLGELKDSLLRILLLVVRPNIINPKERDSAQHQRIENRGSWMKESAIDMNTMLNELNESDITIYTLFELQIISETETCQLLHAMSESISSLQAFTKMIHSNQNLTNHDLYSIFLSPYSTSSCNSIRPLYYPYQMESYPSQSLTDLFLQLEKETAISRIEYIQLYKRCMTNSPALRYCYTEYMNNHNRNAFANNLHLCLSIYNSMKPTRMTQMSESDAVIFEEIIVKQLLQESELIWLLNEYNENNEVILNALSVCQETGDLNGLLTVIHSIMQMYTVYQDELEAKQFLQVLVREMVNNNTINQEQADHLTLLVQESNECMIDLYKEYKVSGDFEGLLAALIYISNSCDILEEEEEDGEEWEEEEEELSLPTLNEALMVIDSIEKELTTMKVCELKERICEGDGTLLSVIARYIRCGDKGWLLQELNR